MGTPVLELGLDTVLSCGADIVTGLEMVVGLLASRIGGDSVPINQGLCSTVCDCSSGRG